ncbi:CPBP family intramembrane glutamic endopeptidase [Pedobacter paludis]|uniref:CPBP family intramembrane metalloprotease domain-containing protein n=1 Tax=Pedobacter paludis TaxID=2203212 RepID=A0A317F229_9SPHI|nr:CPBP family intramembrane glutamic endopeptidase [Pedobacter paludis]PWS32702.1 CPBP family intramembrane metalloprotease domain-containing protein [Pedobacter paludis]
MNFVKPIREESHPLLQIFLLCVYWGVGAILFSALGVLVVLMVYGTSIFSNFDQIMSGAPQFITALKIIQIFSSIGMFILPPIALALTERKTPSTFYGFKKPHVLLLVLVLVIMIVSMPFMEWTAIWNQKMVLPDFLKGIEHWMKEKEDEAMKLTIQLIMVRSNIDFIVNLLMIAVLPAIGEELFFRAGLQGSLQKMLGNHHVAIWSAAIIFSAIHVQFYGFIPRMLLGAGFGYLYYFSGSIWYAMLAHFLNNAYAVCAAFYMQKHNLPLDKADEPIGFPWYGYVISVIITIALFKFFKDTAQRERKLG